MIEIQLRKLVLMHLIHRLQAQKELALQQVPRMHQMKAGILAVGSRAAADASLVDCSLRRSAQVQIAGGTHELLTAAWLRRGWPAALGPGTDEPTMGRARRLAGYIPDGSRASPSGGVNGVAWLGAS
jgi:hypothetical protein